MNLRVSEKPSSHAGEARTGQARTGQARIRFAHAPRGGGAKASPLVGVSLLPDGKLVADEKALSELRSGTAFVIDSVLGEVAPEKLAQMIGCFFFASAAGRWNERVEVVVGDGQGLSATARMLRPDFAIEVNRFGAAYVLYEDDAVGLYVLEIAPGAVIPAHFHRVMRERELVLDPGLLQQNLRVRPGDAFSWPAGYVHEYRNPTDSPKRILCVDRPKFIPEDEVPVRDAPLLIPTRPEWNYLR